MKRILVVGSDQDCSDIEHRVKLEYKGVLQYHRAATHQDAQARLTATNFDAVILARATTVSGHIAPHEAASLMLQSFLREQGFFCVVVDDGAWLQSLIERLSAPA